MGRPAIGARNHRHLIWVCEGLFKVLVLHTEAEGLQPVIVFHTNVTHWERRLLMVKEWHCLRKQNNTAFNFHQLVFASVIKIYFREHRTPSCLVSVFILRQSCSGLKLSTASLLFILSLSYKLHQPASATPTKDASGFSISKHSGYHSDGCRLSKPQTGDALGNSILATTVKSLNC